MLCPSRREDYIELRAMVIRIERDDAALAARLELEGLLDRYVSLLASRDRHADVAERTTRMPYARTRPLAAKIAARRLAHHAHCRREIERLDDELDTIVELVALAAQMAACPILESGEGAIERRLWELDELDAALTTLSLETSDVASREPT